MIYIAFDDTSPHLFAPNPKCRGHPTLIIHKRAQKRRTDEMKYKKELIKELSHIIRVISMNQSLHSPGYIGLAFEILAAYSR
jgi:hypothetical protein